MVSDSIAPPMRIEVLPTDSTSDADVLVVTVAGEAQLPASVGEELARRVGSVAAEEEVAELIGRTAVLYGNGDLPAKRVVAVGLGPAAQVDAHSIRTAAARVAKAAEKVGGTLAWP